MQNDDDPFRGDDTRPSPHRSEPDAHGQAALLLVESVLHALVESKTLTIEQAIDAVHTASEVKRDVAAEAEESSARMNASLALLASIARTLEVEGRFAGRQLSP